MTIVNSYTKGQQPILRVTLTDDDSGAPLAPTSVTLKVKKPSGVVTTYNIGDLTNISAGVYEKAVIADESGTWKYRFESSGTGWQTADEHQFEVAPSAF